MWRTGHFQRVGQVLRFERIEQFVQVISSRTGQVAGTERTAEGGAKVKRQPTMSLAVGVSVYLIFVETATKILMLCSVL